MPFLSPGAWTPSPTLPEMSGFDLRTGLSHNEKISGRGRHTPTFLGEYRHKEQGVWVFYGLRGATTTNGPLTDLQTKSVVPLRKPKKKARALPRPGTFTAPGAYLCDGQGALGWRSGRLGRRVNDRHHRVPGWRGCGWRITPQHYQRSLPAPAYTGSRRQRRGGEGVWSVSNAGLMGLDSWFQDDRANRCLLQGGPRRRQRQFRRRRLLGWCRRASSHRHHYPQRRGWHTPKKTLTQAFRQRRRGRIGR